MRIRKLVTLLFVAGLWWTNDRSSKGDVESIIWDVYMGGFSLSLAWLKNRIRDLVAVTN